MFVRSLGLVFLVCLLRPTQSTDHAISSYCPKSQIDHDAYPPTPIECCDEKSRCGLYIEPGETKYGLTNTDTEWSKRACDCEVRMKHCLEHGLRWNRKLVRKAVVRLSSEECFYRTNPPCKAKTKCTPTYGFITIKELLQITGSTSRSVLLK